MPPKYQIGRKGRVYVAEESTYGVAPTLTPADAVRHLNIGLQFNPYNRVKSPERHRHASQIHTFDRRVTAGLTLSTLLYPSGTLNTVPEVGPLLKGAMGAEDNVTAASTIAAAPAPTNKTATLADASGFSKGQVVLIEILAGTHKGRYARFLTSVSGAAVAWAPALPSAPVTGDTVKGGITYRLTDNDPPPSFTVAHYLPQFRRMTTGAVIDKLKMTLDANDEIRMEFGGPAREQKLKADVPNEPAGYVTVGNNPPSGIKGYLTINDAPFDALKAEIELTNTFTLMNENFGTDRAQVAYRKEKRSVTASVDARVSDDVTLFDATLAGDRVGLFAQTGVATGKIVAVYCPLVDFAVPDTGDEDAENNWSYKGDCLGIDGDDELIIGIV